MLETATRKRGNGSHECDPLFLEKVLMSDNVDYGAILLITTGERLMPAPVSHYQKTKSVTRVTLS